MRRTGRSGRGPPRALLVDLWNTLLVPRGSRRSLEIDRSRPWVLACERVGFPAERARIEVARMRDRAMAIQATGRSVGIAEQARILERRIGRPVAVRSVIAGLREHVRTLRVEVASGALRSLDEVRAGGIPIGLVSNILYEPGDAIRGLLARTRLDERLDAVYLSIEHRAAKPSPAPFRSVLRALGARTADAVHIGDHTDDIRGALAAGIPAIRYVGFLGRYPREPPAALRRVPKGTPTIRRWRGLPERLDGLADRARRAEMKPIPGNRGRRRSRPAHARA